MRNPYEAARENASMDLDDPLYWLEAGWLNYLENKGHHIYHRSEAFFPVVRTRNHKKIRYRWLLLLGHDTKLILGQSEMTSVRQNLKDAKRQNEATYVVVGFTPEPGRVVILPAEDVLKTGYIRSDINHLFTISYKHDFRTSNPCVLTR